MSRLGIIAENIIRDAIDWYRLHGKYPLRKVATLDDCDFLSKDDDFFIRLAHVKSAFAILRITEHNGEIDFAELTADELKKLWEGDGPEGIGPPA